MKKVFISATTSDLGTYRTAAEQELLRKPDIRPVQQNHFNPSYQTIREELRETIEECAAVICLVGEVYGEEPKNRPEGAARRSYTQMEFDLARELGKPVYPFLTADDLTPDEEVTEDAEKVALQAAHREAIANGDRLYQTFRDHAELQQHIARIDFDAVGEPEPKPEPGPRLPWMWIVLGALVAIGLWGGLWFDGSQARPADSTVGGNEERSIAPEKPDGPPVALNFRDSYRQGELMELTVTANRTGYLYVAAYWADGQVYLLYPNFHAPKNGENRVSAGQTIRLPGDLPPAADGRVMTYPMYFPEGTPGTAATETIFAFIAPTPVQLPEVTEDSDLGPAFRRLGLVKDKAGFLSRFRGPGPELRFAQDVVSLPEGLTIVTKDYQIRR